MKKLIRVTTTAERLREALALAGMRQIELSRRSGVSHSSISRYISGELEPRQDAAHKMAAALDVAEMWLWGYDVPMRRTPEQKKNDELVQVVAKLRDDPDFFEVVSILAELPSAEYESIKVLLSRLSGK